MVTTYQSDDIIVLDGNSEHVAFGLPLNISYNRDCSFRADSELPSNVSTIIQTGWKKNNS